MKKILKFSVLLGSISLLISLYAGELEEMAGVLDEFTTEKYHGRDEYWMQKFNKVALVQKNIPILPGVYPAIDQALQKCGYSFDDVQVYRNDLLMHKMGTSAGYVSFNNTIVVGNSFFQQSCDVQEFTMSHECMHKKYVHRKMKEAASYMGYVGICFATCIAQGWKRKIPTYMSVVLLNKFAQLLVHRATEVHADIASIELTGQVQGGVDMFNQLTLLELKHKNKLESVLYASGLDEKIVPYYVAIKCSPLLCTHPTSVSRVAYLEEYEKTGKIPWKLCAKAVLGVGAAK